jgi:hypothetical protein
VKFDVIYDYEVHVVIFLLLLTLLY